MAAFLLWCILLVICWPVAIAALIIYPLVWLILLPFRLVGIAVGGALALVWGLGYPALYRAAASRASVAYLPAFCFQNAQARSNPSCGAVLRASSASR